MNSTRKADTLDKARIVIEEYIKENFDQLYSIGNGALAHNCIVNDLSIAHNPILAELAITVWDSMIVAHQQKMAGIDSKKTQDMTKAEMIDIVNRLRIEISLIKDVNNKQKEVIQLLKQEKELLLKERNLMSDEKNAQIKRLSKENQELKSKKSFIAKLLGV